MNTPQVGPAVCQIDNCGVLAIRRCVNCGRAFCASHQAQQHYYSGRVPAEDMCEPCWVKSPQEVARLEQWDAEQYIHGKWDRVSRAREVLLRARMPTVALYKEERRFKSGLFGLGGDFVTKYIAAGRGWVIGRFQAVLYFSTPEGSMGGRIEVRPAILRDIDNYTNDTNPLPGGVPLLVVGSGPIATGPERGGYAIAGGQFTGDTIKEIAQAIKKMTGEPD